jgi:ABC-2 type transport system permease protein
MRPTLSVFRRELGAYFNTPIGYVFIAAFVVLSLYLYVQNLFVTGAAEMRDYFEGLSFIFVFFIPAISMRLWAEERKLGTLEVLMTMPIKTWQAVAGKYLAGLSVIAVMLFMTLHIPITLKVLGNPDAGPIIGGYLGAMVLGMVFLSIGAFASSLTSDQVVAFIIACCINAIVYLISFAAAVLRDFTPVVAGVIERFGVKFHFDSIARGVVDSRDIIYAVTMSALFLLLNVLVIERRR